MEILLLFVLGVAFAAFAALVFAVLTLLPGKFLPDFELSAPDDWSFFDFYKRYLIVAAVYTFVSIPITVALFGITGPLRRGVFLLPGIAALAAAYKFVFDAGWNQAVLMGTIGGIIALVLFFMLIHNVLVPLGLLG